MGERYQPCGTEGVSQLAAPVWEMHLMHDMLRREFGMAPGLIRNVRQGDTGRAGVVGAHLDMLCRLLHTHHQSEDVHLWPRLLERAPMQTAAIVATMEAQHAAIASTVERIDFRLPSWRSSARRGYELAELFDELLVVLREHTATEEAEILSFCERFITAAEWNSSTKLGLGVLSIKEKLLAFGMLTDGQSSDVVRASIRYAPLAARLLLPRLAPLAFARHSKRLRDATELRANP